MAFHPRTTADSLEVSLRAAGTPERAGNEKRYLKSELEFFGVPLGEIRLEARACIKPHPDLSHDELVSLVRTLWARTIFECRMAAVLLLEMRPMLLGPDDLGLLEQMIRDSHTWAFVDPLAANVLGGIVVGHPGTARALDRWARDPDFWVRRSALLSQMRPLRQGAGFERFSGYADAMLEEREFFIRKAIGWVLRDVSRRDPATVYDWLAPRIDRASGVTVREAVKYLAPNDRAELLAAYRERRGRPGGRPRTTA
jgi:3-methyladenine DNA glycosylase AlkD